MKKKIIPLGANLTHFGAKPTIPDWHCSQWNHGCQTQSKLGHIRTKCDKSVIIFRIAFYSFQFGEHRSDFKKSQMKKKIIPLGANLTILEAKCSIPDEY